MDLMNKINVVVDPSEFNTGKNGKGEKKRARARLYQINVELQQLSNKIDNIKSELGRLEQKLEDKVKNYTVEADSLINSLKEDSPNEKPKP